MHAVTIIVTDQAGKPIVGSLLTIQPATGDPIQLLTDDSGRATCTLSTVAPFHIHLEKSGYFFRNQQETDPALTEIKLELIRRTMLVQSVDVAADPEGIDPHQVSNKQTMGTKEIVNIPYPTSRDIRQILPYFPGVLTDNAGRAHLAGSESWAILDMLDDFDIRSPFNGALALRFSADSVRAIEKEDTRIPVEFGGNTGGVIAFHSVMGGNHYKFSVTDFMPQFEEANGLRFDHYVPRATFTGPFHKNEAWFSDSFEAEFLQHYVPQLSKGSQTSMETRGSNFLRVQWNSTPTTIVQSGLLFNDFHDPDEGLSPAVPRESTIRRNTIGWFPYARIQQKTRGGMIDAGAGMVHFSDHIQPHTGGGIYTQYPGGGWGSNFETVSNFSQNVQTNAIYYLDPKHWAGVHNLKGGVEIDKLGFAEQMHRSPIRYVREDGKLLRVSSFTTPPLFARHNVATGAFIQDHWSARDWLFEPGLRFDWNEITRHAMWSPRFAVALVPNRFRQNTKVAAGIGIYYEHMQLEYLERSLEGTREDTYYAPNGVTPVGAPVVTAFTYDPHHLTDQSAMNWSVSIEQRLPGAVVVKANYVHKHVFDALTYVNQGVEDPMNGPPGPKTTSQTYVLTNQGQDFDQEFDIEAKTSSKRGYAFEVAYTRTSARTNAVIDYLPTLSNLGPQQSGPVAWDCPNHVSSYGWFSLPKLSTRVQFSYSVNWHTGLPFTAIDANHDVIGPANSYRFPDYLAVNPGVEWKFHVLGSYFGLRTVVENVTNSPNPYYVNNNVDSPRFGRFENPPGRALTARIRLIESKGKLSMFH